MMINRSPGDHTHLPSGIPAGRTSRNPFLYIDTLLVIKCHQIHPRNFTKNFVNIDLYETK